jgi:hypothetical protein
MWFQVLMSREFMTDWLVKPAPRKDHYDTVIALAKLPAQFVFDLLIFPLLEAYLECSFSSQAPMPPPLLFRSLLTVSSSLVCRARDEHTGQH